MHGVGVDEDEDPGSLGSGRGWGALAGIGVSLWFGRGRVPSLGVEGSPTVRMLVVAGINLETHHAPLPPELYEGEIGLETVVKFVSLPT
jgi:hypothetical protein